MKYITFKPEFVARIHQRVKVSTIRPTRRLEPGDRVSLRIWTGKPYRSKQKEFGQAIILEINRVIFVNPFEVACEGRFLTASECVTLAHQEGFNTGVEMFQWFEKQHGFPFKGCQYLFQLITE
jgi:hypothetical protein